MKRAKRSAIVISASSDIGNALSLRWNTFGWDVYGTYRTKTKDVDNLMKSGVNLVSCDLLDSKSVKNACVSLCRFCSRWDVLVLCPGTLNPVGAFKNINFSQWEDSIKINFISQMRIVQKLLPSRNINSRLGPCVLFFAGGGTNSATVNYSAYTISKIALTKMCELLDAEINDTRFVIIGPGWVKTKIHAATLEAGAKAGDNYLFTKNKLDGNDCTSIEKVLDCCDWVIESPRNLISGRNFSVVYDRWGTKSLQKELSEDPHMYKLRRHGNGRLFKQNISVSLQRK